MHAQLASTGAAGSSVTVDWAGSAAAGAAGAVADADSSEAEVGTKESDLSKASR